jgi:ferric-dicitrate binding protein FerR (iron transport regulator)
MNVTSKSTPGHRRSARVAGIGAAIVAAAALTLAGASMTPATASAHREPVDMSDYLIIELETISITNVDWRATG